MPDALLVEVFTALADQLETVLAPVIDDLQVIDEMMLNPSPPTIDIYPAPDPFQDSSGFTDEDVIVNLIIRARVSPVDHEGGQKLLYSMMDWNAATSVKKAANANKTLSGKVQDISCGHPSDFAAFVEPGSARALLGCTWIARLTV